MAKVLAFLLSRFAQVSNAPHVLLLIPYRFVLKEEGVTAPTELLCNNIITNNDKQASKNYLHWIFADISWAYSEYLIKYSRDRVG